MEAVEPLALPVVALTRSQVGCTSIIAWPANDDTISQVGVDPDVESGDQVSLTVIPDVDWDACHTEWRETVVDNMVMEKFVLVPEVCPVGSMTSAAEPTFWPALSQVNSLVVLVGGGGGSCCGKPPGGGRVRYSASVCPASCRKRSSGGLCWEGRLGFGWFEPLLDERSVMSCVDLGVTLDGGPMEGAPVLEPFEHSVLEKTLDGRPMEGMTVLEPIEHSVLEVARNGRPMAGISVLEQLEHSVPEVTPVWGDCSLIRMTVSDPLEHSGLGVTVHVDMDSLWMAPWDAGGTFRSSYRSGMAIWRDMLCCSIISYAGASGYGLFEVFWRPRKDMYYRLEHWGVDSPS